MTFASCSSRGSGLKPPRSNKSFGSASPRNYSTGLIPIRQRSSTIQDMSHPYHQRNHLRDEVSADSADSADSYIPVEQLLPRVSDLSFHGVSSLSSRGPESRSQDSIDDEEEQDRIQAFYTGAGVNRSFDGTSLSSEAETEQNAAPSSPPRSSLLRHWKYDGYWVIPSMLYTSSSWSSSVGEEYDGSDEKSKQAPDNGRGFVREGSRARSMKNYAEAKKGFPFIWSTSTGYRGS